MSQFPRVRSSSCPWPVCRSAAARRGLTLLELIVVMAILVAIAAILVPLLPEFLGKANQSSAATNMNELEKGIQTFRAAYSRYPNYFDSMLTGNSATVSALVPASPAGSPGGGNLAAIQLKKGPASRLNREGMTEVYDIVGAATGAADFHATLNPYATNPPTGRPIEENAWVLALKRTSTTPEGGGATTYSYAETAFPGAILNPDHLYVVLGVGKYCNLCGPDGIVKDAPVFGQHKQQNTPAEAYQRYGAVFDVGTDDNETSKVNAKFVGVIAIAGKRLFTCGDLVGTYHDNRFDISQPRE